MFNFDFNPTLINLFGLEVRFYGIVYFLGFYLAGKYLEKKKYKNSWEIINTLIIGMLIGSRLSLILWYPKYYLYNPINLFKFWEGGMSWHGGIFGATIAAYIYCKKNKIKFMKLADDLALPLILAGAFGRIANFLNSELVGTPFNGPWCVNFNRVDELCRHPVQLYAAIKRFFIASLTLKYQKVFPEGTLFLGTLTLDFLGRFFLDFFREDTLFFTLSMGQWLSLAGITICLYYIKKINSKSSLN